MPRLASLAAAGVAVGLALLAVGRFAAYRSEREALLAEVGPLLAGPEAPAALAKLRHEPDLAQARTAAARVLITAALRPGEDGSPAVRLARLELARRLAGETLRARPGNGQAATALGAATYLSLSLLRDDRLFATAPTWEAPLWRARALTPGEEEAGRFLAMAYLELWPALPEWKRQQARELVRQGLADPATFPLLIEAWLGVAAREEGDSPGGLAGGLALMPAGKAYPWRSLAFLLGQRGDWQGYREILEPWWRAVEAETAERIQRADRQLALGDGYSAGLLLHEALAELPVDCRGAPLLVEVLRRLPAGAGGGGAARALEPWLGWSLELCLTAECPLPPPTLARLLALVRPEEPAQAAAAALAAGRFTTALAEERRAALPLEPAWGPYLILKARYLSRRGEAAGGSEALRLVPAPWRDHPAFWRARREVAAGLGDGRGEEAARRTLAAGARERWEAPPWRLDGRLARLAWQTPERAPALLCVSAEVQGRPAAEVLWDGAFLGVASPDGGGQLCLPCPAEAGLHTLELRILGSGGLSPGAVALRGPAPAAAAAPAD